jgi:hypothetical protein
MRRLLLVPVCLAAVAAACSTDTFLSDISDNQPPLVWLGGAPPEGSVSDYRIHLAWGGRDADGVIEYFEYIITDNDTSAFDPADTTSTPSDYKWHRIDRRDSVFNFTADLAADSSDFADNRHEPEEFRRSHTFLVRAVDDRGARSVEPAYRSFTARNFSPVVNILIPGWTGLQPAVVSSITTFEALGWAFVGQIGQPGQTEDPESIRWILVPTDRFSGDWSSAEEYIRSSPEAPEWTDWLDYQPGASQTYDPPRTVPGAYVLAVQARDEAGAVNPVFSVHNNMRRLIVSGSHTGPILIANNRYMGSIITSTTGTSPVFLEVPGGLAMSFQWTADASSYGGIVAGYRYGWDILDLGRDDEWDVPFTPFVGRIAKSPPRSFFFGIHTFYLEVIDNSGFKSRIIVRLNVVPLTMQRNLLVVDDWTEGDFAGFVATRGALPSDAEHDAFWLDMVSGVNGFVPDTDIIEIGGQGLSLSKLGDYQNVIWSAAGSPSARSASVLGEFIRFRDPDERVTGGTVEANIVGMFMAAGGHVLLAGQHMMTLAINASRFPHRPPLYPIIFRYELAGDQDGNYYPDQEPGVRGVGEDSFAYSECCLNVLDIAYLQNPGQIRSLRNVGPWGCPVDHLRDHVGQTDGMRAAMPADVTTGGGFPSLTLRPEVAGDPMKLYHETNLGLNCDIYNPPYFSELTGCSPQAELVPPRRCYEPIYKNECLNRSSVIFDAPVAFWTGQFADRAPDSGGVAARSAVWGFHPVYFNPAEVKQALEIVLFDEWQLPRK